MATHGISFEQFGKIAPYILRSRKPIMGHGKHGIGKSELVYQLADKLAGILGAEFTTKYGKDYVFPVVERRASQMADTGDVIGVREKTSSRQVATKNLEGSQYHPAPPWVDVNVDSLQGTVSRLPQADELEQSVNVQLVVEFYSR